MPDIEPAWIATTTASPAKLEAIISSKGPVLVTVTVDPAAAGQGSTT